MTTRVLLTTVLQKRRAQWALLPKVDQTSLEAPSAHDDDKPKRTADLSPRGEAGQTRSTQRPN